MAGVLDKASAAVCSRALPPGCQAWTDPDAPRPGCGRPSRALSLAGGSRVDRGGVEGRTRYLEVGEGVSRCSQGGFSVEVFRGGLEPFPRGGRGCSEGGSRVRPTVRRGPQNTLGGGLEPPSETKGSIPLGKGLSPLD